MSPDARERQEAFQRRIDRVRERVDIVGVIGAAVKLGRGKTPRGKCPFHGSKSDSFAVYGDRGRARCWGCGWSGDAIAFVRDHYGLSFVDALERLERGEGLDGVQAAPVRREKIERPRREREAVDSLTMAAFILKRSRRDPEAVRTYLRARGVPEAVLGEDRLRDVRFLVDAPIRAWREGAKPSSVPVAPAMVAVVRAAPMAGVERPWKPIGLHVTYLAPSLTAKMVRQRQDGSEYPARKMLGASLGGCVVLGQYRPDCLLYVGEGLETVLSGMAIAGADGEACGIAALSLDNLQGRARLIRDALPLFDPSPDPLRGRALAFPHGGRVVGLIDADMAPLRGPRDRKGGWRGVPVIERRGARIVRRAISPAERTALCGTLFVKAWRACGVPATAMRPAMGQDFNDAVREKVG